MADQNPMGQGADRTDPPDPAAEDSRTEHSVLSLLLDEHPVRLTLDELALTLNAEPRLTDPDDAAERAVYRLACMGLAYRDGRFLTPTRAALYFDRLTKEHR